MSERDSTLRDKAFLVLLVLVTLAFGWILLPFYGAILWATVLATVFAPTHRWLLNVNAMAGRPNLAALVTLLIIVGIVLLPLALTVGSLIAEATSLYERVQSGQVDLGSIFQNFLDALPSWASSLFGRLGLTDVGDIQSRLVAILKEGGQFFATQAVLVGQGTANFVISLGIMLYLLFFLLRDGEAIAGAVRHAIPLRSEEKGALYERYTVVVRAMIKGTVLVAVVQGALGGLIFWLLGIHSPVLWGVVMAFMSLLPAIGAAAVWLPVAIYLLVTGAVLKGIVLIAFGAGVIGLVDNLLRPYLVGKSTRMPDFIVLLSTLGGIAILGLNGFVVGPLIAAMFFAAWDIAAGASTGTQAPDGPSQKT
jgi:predicted PurR-regulated permease PerM